MALLPRKRRKFLTAELLLICSPRVCGTRNLDQSRAAKNHSQPFLQTSTSVTEATHCVYFLYLYSQYCFVVLPFLFVHKWLRTFFSRNLPEFHHVCVPRPTPLPFFLV